MWRGKSGGLETKLGWSLHEWSEERERGELEKGKRGKKNVINVWR
jgi:hypothetical protein